MKRNKFYIFKLVLTVFFILGNIVSVLGQNRCLSKNETASAIKLFKNSANTKFNKSLQKELLKMQKDQQELLSKIVDKYDSPNETLVKQKDKLGENNLLRLCEIVKENGWLTRNLVGEKGVLAAMYILIYNRAADLQNEIFPVMTAAVKAGQIDKSFLASLIDNYRVSKGSPQLFGTRFEIKDEFLVLYPIQDEKNADKWRKIYNLPPLSLWLKELEVANGLPVIKTQLPLNEKNINDSDQTINENTSDIDALVELGDEDEEINIDSNLVNINVRLSREDSANIENLSFEKSDFKIYEDGVEKEVAFLSKTETPFDLILLLDLSGSTTDKQGEIRKSTKRFIETARPQDRISIITFTDEIKLVAELTTDKDLLLKKAGNIGMNGGSKIWDALDYTYTNIIDTQTKGRRSAIVFMTDGVDVTLLSNYKLTVADSYSKVAFADLLRKVRDHETTIFPIYFDTETIRDKFLQRAYRNARRTLEMIADESGGQMYYAKRAKDLEGTYDEIIQDLSKIYSLGYQSDYEKADGSWHVLKVVLPNHPKLKIKTRKGFYSK